MYLLGCAALAAALAMVSYSLGEESGRNRGAAGAAVIYELQQIPAKSYSKSAASADSALGV